MQTTTTTTTTTTMKDLLRSLKPTVEDSNKKVERVEVKLDRDQHEFVDFCAAKHLFSLVKAKLDASQEYLKSVFFLQWTETMWQQRCRPVNPQIVVEKDGKPDCVAIFQVKNGTSVGNPFPHESTDDVEQVFKDGFTQLFIISGVNAEQASHMAIRLVDSEFMLTPEVYIDLKKLSVGSYQGRQWVDASEQDQLLALKIIGLLQGSFVNLTDEERSRALVQKNVMQVKKEFLDRVVGYVNSLEQLRMVLDIVKPTLSFSPVKFAVSDNPETINRRLLSYTKETVLGFNI